MERKPDSTTSQQENKLISLMQCIFLSAYITSPIPAEVQSCRLTLSFVPPVVVHEV